MTDDIKAIRDALAAGPTPSLALPPPEGAHPDWRYIAAVHPERIARLLDALESATKDAERLAVLHRSLEDDGHGYWLPEKCFKEGNQPPDMDEFRATIDAMKGGA